MPMRPVVKVEGLKDVQRAVRLSANEGAKQALKEANRRAAELVVRAALPDVPRGETGNLKKTVKALGRVRDAVAKAGTPARVPYAAAVHWGTGPRLGLRGPHNIARRPFLFDAAERLRGRIAKEYLEEIDRILNHYFR